LQILPSEEDDEVFYDAIPPKKWISPTGDTSNNHEEQDVEERGTLNEDLILLTLKPVPTPICSEFYRPILHSTGLDCESHQAYYAVMFSRSR